MQIGRAVFHQLGGLFTLLFVQIMGWRELELGVAFPIAWILALSGELGLRKWQGLQDFAVEYVGMRKEELNNMTAMTSYLLGITIAYWIFPLHIAFMSVFILAYGDPAARICGMMFKDLNGDNGSKKKTIAGFCGFCVASMVALALTLAVDELAGFYPPIHPPTLVYMMLVGTFAGAITEWVGWFDNTTIPIVSGGAMWASTLILI